MFLKINFHGRIKKVNLRPTLQKWETFEPELKKILQIPQKTSLKIHFIDQENE